MRFAISMTDIEGEWDRLSEERQQAILAEHKKFKKALRTAGKFVDALHYHPREQARTIRMDADGTLRKIDGPFELAREYIGGVYLIEADSIDEALEWARKGRFMTGANEVRQIWD
jgi:hypothetical protein